MQYASSSTTKSSSGETIVYVIVAVLVFMAMGTSIAYWFLTSQSLQAQSRNLQSLDSYSLATIENNATLKDEIPLWKTITDIFSYSTQLKDDITNYSDYRKKLLIPYTHFLHYIYLPSLNIWENTFSQDIDTTLIGAKYLTSNPYDDIALIQKRTNFFKDMGTADQYNTITDISIGATNVVEGGFFAIPITVQFETPNRRSFLMLINKLSMTSDLNNISLTNEFIYNLRDVIKTEKKDALHPILSGLNLSGVQTDDDLVGYLLYQRVYSTGNMAGLLDSNLLNKAMTQTAGCTTQTSEECLYLFREKYRTIPYLAYGIARPGTDNVVGLRNFLRQLPPIITITSFSFDLKDQKAVGKVRDDGYKGSISINVYGKDVSDNEMQKIAGVLGTKCFRDGSPMGVSLGQARVNNLIEQIGGQNVNVKRFNELTEMKKYIDDIATVYDTLPYYKKVIKLFEIYRTLYEGDTCDILADASVTTKGSIKAGGGETIGEPKKVLVGEATSEIDSQVGQTGNNK